jgi:hypothetical protein
LPHRQGGKKLYVWVALNHYSIYKHPIHPRSNDPLLQTTLHLILFINNSNSANKHAF